MSPAGVRKPGRNPFFTMLMIVSTLFVVTTLGYLVGPFVAQREASGAANPVSHALAAWFERKGVLALGIEFVVMTVLAVLAMTTDRFFDSRTKQREIPRAGT